MSFCMSMLIVYACMFTGDLLVIYLLRFSIVPLSFSREFGAGSSCIWEVVLSSILWTPS
jgi:hypothetical protein